MIDSGKASGKLVYFYPKVLPERVYRFWGPALLIFLIEFAQQIRNASLSGRRAWWGLKGQSPSFAVKTDSQKFLTTSKTFQIQPFCRRQNPKHHQKTKTPADMAGVFHAVLYAFSSGAETGLSPATGISGVSDTAAPVSSSREGVEPSLSSSPFISLTKVSPLAFSFLIRYWATV